MPRIRGGSHKAKRYRLKSVISLYRAPNGLKSSKSIAIYIQNAALFSNPVFKVQNDKVFFLGGGGSRRGERPNFTRREEVGVQISKFTRIKNSWLLRCLSPFRHSALLPPAVSLA